MRKVAQSAFGGVISVKLVVASVAAMLLAGCSDSVDRFASNYSNPSDSDPVYTASIMKPKRDVPADGYQASDMADNGGDTIVQSPVANAPLAKPPSKDYTTAYSKTYNQAPVAAAAPAYAQPKYAYNAPANAAPVYKAPVITDDAQAADNEIKPFKKKKGPKITVAEGMSLYDIAKANHITIKQLADANNLKSPYTVAPGTELIVPGTKNPIVPQVAMAKPLAPVAPVAEKTAQADEPTSTANEHIVAKGDTLFSLGRQYKVSGFAIADANGLSHDKSLPIGRKLKIPAAGTDKLAKASTKDEGKTDLAAKSVKTSKDAPATDVADNTAGQETIEPAKPVATDAAAADAPLSLRWPVRGRIISAYGSKPNGMKNEGINIMAPEGTNIQAADAGVVAYAGNELKGYGNLVLIRHAGGYVTAYAHAASLLVKKGDIVKRGDVIGKVGQTGAVQSAQLHFEVRKGATALDPATFLNANSASN
ncbi:MAG: LysM peptidoglycan-binding domain-containing M23 family metallopeptidase [Aestuariivirga sp.]